MKYKALCQANNICQYIQPSILRTKSMLVKFSIDYLLHKGKLLCIMTSICTVSPSMLHLLFMKTLIRKLCLASKDTEERTMNIPSIQIFVVQF